MVVLKKLRDIVYMEEFPEDLFRGFYSISTSLFYHEVIRYVMRIKYILIVITNDDEMTESRKS